MVALSRNHGRPVDLWRKPLENSLGRALPKPVQLCARACCVCLALALPLAAASPSAAHAQQRSSFSLRAQLGLATMTSSDQTGYLHFDQEGVVGALQLGYALLPWLDARLGTTGGGFLSSSRAAGGLLAPITGLLAHLPGLEVTPLVMLDIGAGFTGKLARPFMQVAVGVDFALGPSFALGPLVGHGRVFQTNAPGDSTDAGYLFVGLSLSYRANHEPQHVEKLRPSAATMRAPIREPKPDPAPPDEPPDETPASSDPSPDLLELIDKAVPVEKHQIELLAPVLFEFDSDALEPIGVAMLHEVAHLLAERDDIELIEIAGYADKRGEAEYNRALSDRRARAVLAWLVAHGVAETRLSVAAQGASAFVEPGETESAHEQNRRVVFRVLRTKGD